ncbi:MAG: type II toxin-antitoxin system HipA family toxin [Myxococcaceae bacterium]
MATRNRAERESVDVVLDAEEITPTMKVGTLRFSRARTDFPPSFDYDSAWLANDNRFQLDPRLELFAGEQHPPSNAVTFGILQDAAPDRWGRMLMERREGVLARREGRRARRLGEMDFLLGVHDLARSGALRFRSNPGGHYLDDSTELAAPPLTSLRELAHVSQKIEEPGADESPEMERWLTTLIAPGTSLGGARPKASFAETDGSLWIGKFPAREDRYDVGAWELVVHQLAKEAKVDVPRARLEKLTDRYSTFCVARFDRSGNHRRMFASAMTLLERRDGDSGASYLALAEVIANHGASGHIEEDLAQLFRRVVFNVLVSNRDDHLRNHGFLRTPSGWRLAPAYDMNPNPDKQEHALTLDDASAEPRIDTVLETAELYRLTSTEAEKIVSQVRTVVSRWKAKAKSIGLPRAELQRMESAFANEAALARH